MHRYSFASLLWKGLGRFTQGRQGKKTHLAVTGRQHGTVDVPCLTRLALGWHLFRHQSFP